MSDRATIKALCKKHGWIFAEEDLPDDPRWREGSRIYFPGSSMQPTTSSSENENDSRENDHGLEPNHNAGSRRNKGMDEMKTIAEIDVKASLRYLNNRGGTTFFIYFTAPNGYTWADQASPTFRLSSGVLNVFDIDDEDLPE